MFWRKKKAKPAPEFVAMEAEQTAIATEAARLNELAKSDRVEAERQAETLVPRLEAHERKVKAYQLAHRPGTGRCLRCAATDATLTYRGKATYFQCGWCGSRGRWDLYQ